MISAWCLSTGALADKRISSQQVLDLVVKGEIVSILSLQEQHSELQNVRWLDIELEREHGIWLYEMKVIDEQGEIFEYTFNAETGELLHIELED
ncbi:MAG: hypothetical protein R3309_00425 [Reinekea sp.]|jgi:uncharacterized membrane protein YkoI|nr:hypothetical protein [Reinekea sp.]MDX1472598.1 hypothetical protein [Reinekea sp.]